MTQLQWNSNLMCRATDVMYLPCFKLISPKHVEKQSLHEFVYHIYILYITYHFSDHEFKQMNLIICGCKVGQKVLIAIKLEVDGPHCLLYVYTRVHIQIQQNSGKLKRHPNWRAKRNATIPQIKVSQNTRLMLSTSTTLGCKIGQFSPITKF